MDYSYCEVFKASLTFVLYIILLYEYLHFINLKISLFKYFDNKLTLTAEVIQSIWLQEWTLSCFVKPIRPYIIHHLVKTFSLLYLSFLKCCITVGRVVNLLSTIVLVVPLL